MTRPEIVDGVVWLGALPLRSLPPAHCCPFCRARVGYIGRALDKLFGVQFHGCNFSNVMHPQEAEAKQLAFREGEEAGGRVLLKR